MVCKRPLLAESGPFFTRFPNIAIRPLSTQTGRMGFSEITSILDLKWRLKKVYGTYARLIVRNKKPCVSERLRSRKYTVCQ